LPASFVAQTKKRFHSLLPYFIALRKGHCSVIDSSSSSIMPILTSQTPIKPRTSSPELLEKDFEELTIQSTPSQKENATVAAVVTPTAAATAEDDDEFSADAIVKTEHKLAEERGFPNAEPLLQENPHRFVLFPIQDDDVSTRK
jgi:hypothetical protein